ncbi:hypothetical protein M406DRAFT_217459, partial [Cryphonectria parasitica EP155]
GKALDLQDSVLRQYTDYDAHGTPRSPLTSSGVWTSNTFGRSDVQTTLDRLEEDIVPALPIFDVFSTKTFKAVLENTAAVSRLRAFAESRGRADDMDFLLQIAEYNRTLALLGPTVWSISLKHTGVAASAPVKLPLAVARSLNTDMREVSNTLLPSLENLFDDARTFIEQSLARDIYPEFLKHQLSLNLQTVGRGYSPNQVCPGFGHAFCLTDPNQDDNPMVFASDNLAHITGYRTGDVISKNCRIFQGPRTRASGIDRIRHAISTQNEFTDLVLNYTQDGRMYWNLLFVARLVGLDGEIRYHLGGQIDVTEMLERQEDVTHFLGVAPPLSSREPSPLLQKPRDQQQDSRASWRNEAKGDRPQERERERDERTRYPPSASRNKLLQSFRRRYSQTGSSDTDGSANLPASEPSSPREVVRKSSSFSTPSPSPHQVVVSPYSRFMVSEYIKPSASLSPPREKKKNRAQLPLTFCSASALESLGIGNHEQAGILGSDIFEILSEKTGSNSITKTFKSTVRAGLAEGRAVKLDLSLEGSSRPSRPRGLSLSLEKLVSISNSSASGANFVSYWTPLKDNAGVVRWVVLILLP